MTEVEKNYIVFYDGDCGFCNRTVQFILQNEKTDKIHFTALQSEFTVDFLKKHNFPEPDFSTLYFWSDGKLLQKSTAALEISKQLKRPLSWLPILKIIPRYFRDLLYDFIAKNRKRISKNTCFFPSESEKKRFLKTY